MIFSWFSTTPIQNDITTPPTTKEEDGWIQVITEQVTEDEEAVVPQQQGAADTPTQQPSTSVATKQDTCPQDTVAKQETSLTTKRLSRQERRYQARVAQQQAKKEVVGEEQLKAALKRNRHKKQMLDKWNTACLPTSSFALD
ncbi:hypothetical protein [Absidia glauca]|uniref:Uncharacterized protein n=1 Tax=Absidia glauca TaxID=4829 RepID=A0A163JD64_ABSGL|nr:hypothetical protein [Absidia glauca]